MPVVREVVSTVDQRAEQFCSGLSRLGYSLFSGVPCSLLTGLYRALEQMDLTYYPATREDLAVGLATGAALAGRRCAVLMQNSGLGVSMNALLTLPVMYRLPVLLVVAWRGEGADAPEHITMGQTTPDLLRLLQIPTRLAADPEALAPDFHMQSGPIALLVRKGDFA